jgi:hypothetical protein
MTTTVLLIVFSALFAAGALALAGWATAQWAAGREFDRLGLPGDIAQALHAELDARWRASLNAGGALHGLQ